MSLLLLLRNAVVNALHGKSVARVWSEPAARVAVRSRKRGRLLISNEQVACVTVQSRAYTQVHSVLLPDVVVLP